MFLKSFQFFLVALLLVPVSVFASTALTVVGRVTAVTPCQDASGYVVSLQASTTQQIIFKNALSTSYPPNTLPQIGQQIFGVLGTTTACGSISGRFLRFFSPTTFFSSGIPTSNPPSSGTGTSQGGGIGSSIMSSLSGIIQQIQHFLTPQSSSQNSQTQTQPSPSDSGSARGGGVGIGVFGGLIALISPCDEGFLYAVVGSPYSGPLMWVYGVSSLPPYLYSMGTPPITGFQIIGHFTAFSTCTLGVVTIGGGPIMYGYGTGLGAGGGAPAPSKPASKPTNGNACAASQFDLTNSAGKAQAEAATRKQLSSEGITVNKSFCGIGQSFQAASGGCTDVSGLQCGALTDLQGLASKCGGFEITGGNESGHATHSAGNATDISSGSDFSNSISQCIETKFPACGTTGSGCSCTHSTGKEFCDPTTSTTFWQENVGATAHNTGAHWHVCFGGKGC